MSNKYHKLPANTSKKNPQRFSEMEEGYYRMNSNVDDEQGFATSRSQQEYEQYLEELRNQRSQRRKSRPTGFEIIPSQMKKFRAREAEKVRDHMQWMLVGHIVFIAFEIFVYPFIISIIASEFIYLWVLYYGYMTLNPWAVYGYIAMMFIAPVSGLMKITQICCGLKVLLFIAQLAIYGFCGGFMTLKLFRIWSNAKNKADIDREVRKSRRELIEVSLNEKVQNELTASKRGKKQSDDFTFNPKKNKSKKASVVPPIVYDPEDLDSPSTRMNVLKQLKNQFESPKHSQQQFGLGRDSPSLSPRAMVGQTRDQHYSTQNFILISPDNLQMQHQMQHGVGQNFDYEQEDFLNDPQQYTPRSGGNNNYRLFDPQSSPTSSPIEPYRKPQKKNINERRATWNVTAVSKISDNSPKKSRVTAVSPISSKRVSRVTAGSPKRKGSSPGGQKQRKWTGSSKKSDISGIFPTKKSEISGVYPMNHQPPSEYSDL